MSLFSLFKRSRYRPTPTKAAEMARSKSPLARRLGGLKSYQSLTPTARKIVWAIVIDGQDPDMAASALPNGHRLFETQKVQNTLADAGWTPDPDPLGSAIAAEYENLPISEAAKAPRSDSYTVEAPQVPPQTPQGNVENKPTTATPATPRIPRPRIPVASHNCSGNGCPVCHVAHAIHEMNTGEALPMPVEPEDVIPRPTVTMDNLSHLRDQLDSPESMAYDSEHQEIRKGVALGTVDPRLIFDNDYGVTGRTAATYSPATGYVTTEETAARERDAQEQARQDAARLADAPRWKGNR